MAKVLIVEDEKGLVKILKYNLEKEGYQVSTAQDGEAALVSVRTEKPDLIILDLMIPKLDGFEVCRILRKDSNVPILMLTSRKEEVDRILGLELGADDYVTKPFSVREISARIKAILRRSTGVQDGAAAVKAGALEIDLDKYEVRVKGKNTALSTKEFELLKCLFLAKGKALTRDQILEKVWGYDKSMDIDTRTVDQHVARLRERLSVESERVITVKNVGYRLKLD